MVSERADAQVFILFDTSLSMRASAGPGQPTRLERAKQMALRLQHALSDVRWHRLDDRSLPSAHHADDRPHALRAHDPSSHSR